MPTIEQRDTATPLEPYRTDWSEEDDGFWSGVGTVVDQVNLDYGDDIAEKSRGKSFREYEDYDTNKKFYDAYADNTAFFKAEKTEDLNRNIIEKHIENGRFTLDSQGNVQDTENNWTTGFIFDMDMVKGALLAKQNGWNSTKAKVAYTDYTKAQQEQIQKELEAKGVGLGQLALGMVAGHGFRETTLKEIAVSPQRVLGKTIAGAALKAFTVEAGIAVAGEIEREMKISQHKELSDQEYGLWDSAKNILIASGFAGGIRAGGSAFLDWRLVKNIKGRGVGSIAKELEKKGVPIEEAKLQQEVVERFFRREMYMLTGNTTKHLDMMSKAERDINQGKPVDISKHTELSVEDKVKELGDDIDDVAENSLEAETKNISEVKRVDAETKQVEETIDTATEFKPLSKDDPFEGSATKQEGETLIEEAGNKAEYDEIQAKIDALEKPLSERSQQIKEVAEPKIGGSEEEAKEAVKQHFKKTDDKYKGMSKEDIAEQDRMAQAEADFEAEQVFAKFGDNLAAGTIAGISEDENGNITFDAEKFVTGLGGYTALKALVKNPKVQKEFKEWAERALEELESNPKFNYLTGKQSITEQSKALRKMTREELEHIDTDILDKEAFGVNIGDKLTLDTKVVHPTNTDIENAEYKFKQGGMEWVRSVDFTEPIEVYLKDGKYHIEDGHHRWFAASKLGKKINAIIDDIKNNPIDEILGE